LMQLDMLIWRGTTTGEFIVLGAYHLKREVYNLP
jgi:hypothetical protein